MDNFDSIIQIALPDKVFNDHLREHIAMVKKIMKDDTTSIGTTFFIHLFNDPQYIIAPVIMTNGTSLEHDKQDLMEKSGYRLGKDGKVVLAVFFLSEAWAIKLKSPEEEKAFTASGKKVSEMETKEEVIVLTGLTIDARKNGYIATVSRTPTNAFHIEKERTQLYTPKGKDIIEAGLLTYFYIGLQKGLRVYKKIDEPDPKLEEGFEIQETQTKLPGVH